MDDQFETGKVVSGKVTGIQPYGAFVSFNHDQQGLIHISEITDGYVRDIHDYLTVGEEVTVKILFVNEAEGKISLSLKALEEPKRHQTRQDRYIRNLQSIAESSKIGFDSLREKLADWIEESKKEHLIHK